MKTIMVTGYKCERCRHSWVPRIYKKDTKRPKICPKCKSALWDTQKGKDKAAQVT